MNSTYVVLFSSNNRRLLWLLVITVVVFLSGRLSATAGGCTSIVSSQSNMTVDTCAGRLCFQTSITVSGMHGSVAWHIGYGDGTSFDSTTAGSGTVTVVMALCHQYANPGNYIVTLSVAPAHSSCITQFSVNIPYVMTSSISSTQTACSAPTGTATVNISTGSPPYNYLWSNGGTTSSITDLYSGIYNVTIMDTKNCPKKLSITVSSQSTLAASVTTVSSTSCMAPNGTATVYASSGVSPYTYVWYNGQTTSTLTGIGAGTYMVTVTDNQSCVVTTSGIVGQQSTLGASTTTTPSTGCTVPTGTATVNAFGGASPYTYLWYNGKTTSVVTGLSASTFKVTVTDDLGCIVSTTANVAQATTNPTLFVPQANVTCPGGSDGIASVTAIGTSPFTYLWSNGGTDAAIRNLPAGPYCITVADGGGCTSSQCITILQPLPLILTTTTSATVCGGSTGSANVNASGGTYPYTAQWFNSQTTFTITNLAVGVYSVTVTDAKLCTATASATVTPTVGFVIILTKTDVACNGGSNGSATVTATGTGGPFTYLWSNGSSTDQISSLSPQSYSVTVTDVSGCTDKKSLTISQPAVLVLSVSSTQTACNPATGKATVIAAGGTPPYTYLWSDGQVTSTATGLSAGSYSIVVTDAHDCTAIKDISVTSFPPPTININPLTSAICYGQPVSLTASGGASYSWSPSSGLSSTTNAVVSANPSSSTTYTVVGTDVNGCTNTANTLVSVYAMPVIAVNTVSPVCIGQSVSLTVSGGNSYSWGPSTGLSSTTDSIVTANPSSTTTYTITGTGPNGCTGTATVTVAINQLPSVSANPTTAICLGKSVSLTASGASTYTWSPSTGLTSTTGAVVTANPTAGQAYTVTGTDGNGCINTASLAIAVNQLPVVSASSAAECSGTSAILSANGALTYTWSPAIGLSSTTGATVTATDTATIQRIYTYTITGTDANGCSSTANTTLTVNPLPIVSVNSVTDLICPGTSVTLTASGALSYEWSPSTGLSSTTGTTVSASPSTAVTYTVIGTDANGCSGSGTKLIIVRQLPAITLSPVPADICQGGSIALKATSIPTCGYTWSPATGLSSTSGSSVTASPSATTTYTVTTGTGCCVNTATITVNVTPLPVVSASSGSICSGQTTTLSATGATSYTWSPSTALSSTTGAVVTASDTANSVQKIYTYTVTGNTNGCTGTATATLTVTPYPVISISPLTDLICPGQSLTLTASGAVNYTWSPAAGLSSTTGAVVIATPSTATTYTVVGTDANGCSGTATKLIIIKQIPSLTLSPVPAVICIGGSITLKATSIPVCGYTWSPATGLSSTSGSSVVASPTATTTYTVTTGTGCCVITSTITVTVNQCVPFPHANFASSDTVICIEGGKCVDFYDKSTGSPTSWQWFFPNSGTPTSTQQNPTHICYTLPGTYPVTLIVSNSAGTDTLNVAPLIIYGQTPIKPVIHLVGNDTLVSSYGYTYQWFYKGSPIIPSATDSFYIATQAGAYTVRVTDSLGCSSGVSDPFTFTGIPSSLSIDKEVSVFPNPAYNQLYIAFSKPLKKDIEVSITNVIGQELGKKILSKSQTLFSLSTAEYSSGIYFLKFDEGTLNVNKKFIVLH